MSKNFILACPDVSENRINSIKEAIGNWLSTQSLKNLINAFGGDVPVNVSLDELANWYLDFCECWDFRGKQKQAYDKKIGEGARWLLDNGEVSESQKKCVFAAISDLGLIDNYTARGSVYDYIWVLGGAKLSCLLRSRLAHDVIRNKQIDCKTVVFLASMRPIGDKEREATNTYAPNAKTEFDLFVASAQSEFGVGTEYLEERFDDENNENNSWIIRTYETSECKIIIIAAPSSEPHKRRANSADTYNFFSKRYRLSEGQSILLCTSQIYVPYQHLEAVRTIAVPYKVELDTIGFPVEWGGNLQGMNEPSNYLQEIRSTIQSIGRFLNEY